MSGERRCCRPACPNRAVATLTYVYADSTVVVGPLASTDDPHSWDLCAAHALRITAPRGWELVRHPDIDAEGAPDADLTALLDAVTGGPVGAVGTSTPVVDAERLVRLGVTDPAAARSAAAAPASRGHLRAVPSPAVEDEPDRS